MTRTVAVIQARLGSQRFPEKMLALLGNRSLLEWVVTRVRRSEMLDRVVVATTQESRDDRLADECARLGVDVMRGPTDDVLARFAQAVEGDAADAVVRVCADNPFIDPACIDELVREYRRHGVDYAYNHRPHGACDYADGFGAEILSRGLLDKLQASDLSARHREHVTLAVVDGTIPALTHACIAPKELAYPKLRFDVDTANDLKSLNQLIALGQISLVTTAAEVVRVALRETAT
ncbi:MAG: spore coat polysaccharide biosynthesis protein spsF [Actinomycetota bacterium]|jgi:spore coat polysaccharide biosynthesis protein SpsF